jgi:uncharacterized protein
MADHSCHIDGDKTVKDACHPSSSKNIDFVLWGSILILAIAYGSDMLMPERLALFPQFLTFAQSVVELLNKMWWGVLIGIFTVGILANIPREFILCILGRGGTLSGILRAMLAGVLLDLCSHGILMIGAKLYERGASLGQVMAFLIASPWNSFSLTLILWALVGFKWMMALLLLSMVIAIISGIIFDRLVKHGTLPKNPRASDFPEHFPFWKELRAHLKTTRPSPASFLAVMKSGLLGSTMVLRWIFFGVILAALIRMLVPPHMFAMYFGPSLLGLGMTIIVATILEVCSEGSLPIASDILTRAGAPGNAFAFLMTGVSTDYTEILVLKETTKSWKISLFLPLITVPQVLAIAWVLNQMT